MVAIANVTERITDSYTPIKTHMAANGSMDNCSVEH
jgi:hypothetical protein